jgi:hypothetical protein
VRAYNLKGDYHDTYCLGCLDYPRARDIVRCMDVGAPVRNIRRLLKVAGELAE